MSLLAPTLQAFFTDRLITQRDASPSTVAAYRDTFRLLLAFVEQHTRKQPYQLDLADLDAPLIGAFLTHLEHDRHNTPRTRNARLAAIHSFYRYAALRHPEHLDTIARIMAIPTKRHERNDLTYLTQPEIEALINTPDQATWLGRRDHTLLLTMITTGVRVSELVAIKISDVTLVNGAQHLRVHGKGRKNRTTPLKAETTTALRAWLRERAGAPENPLFPTRQGHPLHRQTVALLVTKHARAAAARCPSLATKHVGPHTLRHTNAMLLQAERIDIATIALWLGHESIKTTYIYQHADNQLKQEAIDRTATIGTPPGRYQPPDSLIAFLEGL
ncbi:MAG TPA: tyrosine-type recombinase/integrase [Solirubrobacteraceae bacterium]|nr:tyrosine-type recombinase/integrase [Solirubrobacteraceae bacterium]